MSFWYHLSFDDIDHMPMAAIEAYMKELPGILAEWRINMMDTVMLPHLKDGDRKRHVRQTRLLAYGEDGPRRVVVPPRMLALLGIGVRVVR